jgi:hypothetical protein
MCQKWLFFCLFEGFAAFSAASGTAEGGFGPCWADVLFLERTFGKRVHVRPLNSLLQR